MRAARGVGVAWSLYRFLPRIMVEPIVANRYKHDRAHATPYDCSVQHAYLPAGFTTHCKALESPREELEGPFLWTRGCGPGTGKLGKLGTVSDISTVERVFLPLTER